MKKILVIGSKGMAGHVIYRHLTKLNTYQVYGVARNVENSDRIFNLDVINTNSLNKIFELKFDIVINCNNSST